MGRNKRQKYGTQETIPKGLTAKNGRAQRCVQKTLHAQRSLRSEITHVIYPVNYLKPRLLLLLNFQ